MSFTNEFILFSFGDLFHRTLEIIIDLSGLKPA